MSKLDIIFDSYSRRARLWPMVVVLLPLGLGFYSWVPLDMEVIGSLGALAGTIGISMFLSQLARDLGKTKEPDLFNSWGGKPSTLMLSYQHSNLSHHTLSRYHRKLKENDPLLNLPMSLEEELLNPDYALDCYDSCGDLLREKTRDKDKFPLIFQENMNYGFRRNLWGMKTWGIFASLMGIILCTIKAIYLWNVSRSIHIISITCALVCLMLMMIWIFRIKPTWVKLAADAYAERLVASCETL
jgi:hypothetical protein